MFQLRGNNKTAFVDGYKFRSGEYEGLIPLIRRMNYNMFESPTSLESEYEEAIRWLHENQNELPRMKGSSSGEGAAYKPIPPFRVGRKYDEWAHSLLDECEESIKYIDQVLSVPLKDKRRARLLRAMRSDLYHTRDWLKEGTAGLRYPLSRRTKEHREVYLDSYTLDAEMQRVQRTSECVEENDHRDRIELVYARAGLTFREKEIFEMKHGANMSVSEIAEVLGITAGTVRGLLSRAGRKIKKVVVRK
jgi:RNA polymerase sigma factor (sigma-70 family)